MRLAYFIAVLSLAGSSCQHSLSYEFAIVHDTIRMKDGVKLAVTYFVPRAQSSGERFPVLFEMLPYRKDDFFYARDFPIYSYFAKAGFLMAKVDIRGTGSSEGQVPPREYSEEEMNDALEIIDQLSRYKDSNGNIGMWGLSWGGFNSLQVRMRKPPALKAVLAIHASDDLYHDDIHYIDGIRHFDSYSIDLEGDTTFPRAPDYLLDESYFRDRFDQYPWFLSYLKQQRDGGFWRRQSVRFDSSPNNIPLYLIGGLNDGYRDTVSRMLQKETTTIQAEIGPWNHDFPSEGTPGPNYEWRDRAIQWWNRWLRNSEVSDGKKSLIAFVRSSERVSDEVASGVWKSFPVPPEPGVSNTFFLSNKHSLQTEPPGAEIIYRVNTPVSHGVDAGNWWGDQTPDMRNEDDRCIYFDSDVMAEKLEIVGTPLVSLEIEPGAELVHWVVRLEDIAPDGTSHFVTGAAVNGSQIVDRLFPRKNIIGGRGKIILPMHFTTWVFEKGHRVRLAIANGQFPMLWPAPSLAVNRVFTGAFSHLALPGTVGGKLVTMPPVAAREVAPDVEVLENTSGPTQVERDSSQGRVKVSWEEKTRFKIGSKVFNSGVRTESEVRDNHSAHARFRGEMERGVMSNGRGVRVRSHIDVHSDERYFHVQVRREVQENGFLIRERIWREDILRDFQ